MNRTKLVSTFFAVVVIAGLAAYVANPYGANIFGKKYLFRLGLDLQGGTHLEYRGELKDIAPADHKNAMSSVRDVIERRVNAFGVSEPLVQLSGQDRLIIELPGIKDIDAAVKQIGQTPFLEFREENSNYKPSAEAAKDPSKIDPKEMFLLTKLTGAQLSRAEVTFGDSQQAFNTPQVSLQFNDEGKKLFAELTSKNVNKRLAIFLDGELLSAPVVQTAITDGRAVITGNFNTEQAKQLATRLNSGALPVPIQLLSQQNVGPTLGKASVNKSILAGVIGLAVVALFMIVYYGLPGLLAVIALIVYTCLALALFKLLNITLTLAGIAGFILSIGMAIDANILIFERTREELRRGKDIAVAIEDGFGRAWSSIRDSNVSSLITTFVLAYFGSSIIRGFAITLAIGIAVSLFSAITVTRTFLRMIIMFNTLRSSRLFGIRQSA